MPPQSCGTCRFWEKPSGDYGRCEYLERTLPFWAQVSIPGDEYPGRWQLTRGADGVDCNTWGAK